MKTIFDKDFYPTPADVIETMLAGEPVEGKTILEPSAGSGNIVQWLKARGAAEVLACEKDPDFAAILAPKCTFLEHNFFDLQSDRISHIDAIYMNPPFSDAAKHILHAWDVAPGGCRIISLCNSSLLKDTYSQTRQNVEALVNQYGQSVDLGQCFSTADRKTDVEVSMITLIKPGGGYEAEFEGFFLEDDPAELQANAIMPYNLVRDIVNRYIGAIKIYDQQLETASQLNSLLHSFYGEQIGFQCTEKGKPLLRNTFKKDLQKAAWAFVFNKLDMKRTATRGLREDINKFVEQQQQIPFTMRNIYRMLEIVNGTTEQRMDKALLEVFDKVTQHYKENRHNVEGWVTNDCYLVNRKFILPYVVAPDYRNKVRANYYGWAEPVDDLSKALCYLTGRNYETIGDFSSFLSRGSVDFGELTTWGFFQFRAYKKGTVHFTFLDEDVWARFNQRIAQLKGYQLPETMKPRKEEKQKQPRAKSNNTPGSFIEPWKRILHDFVKSYDNEKAAKLAHRLIIKKALSDGLPVPPEVLADYPDLHPVTEEVFPEIELADEPEELEPELEPVFEDPNQLTIF